MEELKYVIEDSTIIKILGIQNFSTKESAVLEIVKNAYDAGATELNINFESNQIIITDNGCGMTYDDIKKNWMHIGQSNKGYDFKDIHDNARVFAGSKGIGRFALARLGETVKVVSQNQDHEQVIWITDWNKNTLDTYNANSNLGTTIYIGGLRDKWNDRSIDILLDYISRAYNSDLMSIKINYNGQTSDVKKCFDKPKLGVNCLNIIRLRYKADERKLHYRIVMDEFAEEAKMYVKNKDIHFCDGEINLLEEIDKALLFRENININFEDRDNYLSNLGDFTAEFYFNMNVTTSEDMDKFLYKYKSLPNRYSKGIILYRNAFSISSYEGTKDWLELGKRARKSPAAASHPTGEWRVRENQVSGYVDIDKVQNENLKDMSNRQGLEENIYYQMFKLIIHSGIRKFENYRQGIIRDIDKKNGKKEPVKTPIMDMVISTPKAVRQLEFRDVNKLAKELQQVKKDNEEGEKYIKKTEEKYKYDIRILNMLSTIGLRASSVAHEMQNDRNNISYNYEHIVKAMKAYKIWDIVNEPDKTQYSHTNIPELLLRNKEIDDKVVKFMDTMLENIEKEQFAIKEQKIINILGKVKEIWTSEYSWVTINVSCDDLLFNTAEDVIKVLLDNLILNSIQQNDRRSSLIIDIDLKKHDNQLFIVYKDNGKGLVDKYKKDPMRILEVHESSRENGHGLGMWIINNTLIMTGGKVIDIPVGDGFEIQMILGDMS